MKKVSIIIPLYNLEKLIGKCIASALAQDLSPEEYEILVIDDGSTDGSLAAAEKAAQGHPNVHVYTKPNEGLSRTRNYGTDRAAGRYVMYLDADDYLEPNVLGRLVETMECGGLDMLCFEIAGIDENGNDVPLWSDGISAGNGSDVQRGVDFLQRDRFLPMVYAYLYSREMLDANSLRMTPIWHEDEEFTPRALYYARRIQYLPVRVYNYLQRSDSFMGNYKPQSRLDLVRAMKSLTCFASRIGAEDPSGARLMRLHVGKTMSLACKQTVVRQLGNAREMLREARRQGIMPLEFRRRDFRHFLINRLPGLYVLQLRAPQIPAFFENAPVGAEKQQRREKSNPVRVSPHLPVITVGDHRPRHRILIHKAAQFGCGIVRDADDLESAIPETGINIRVIITDFIHTGAARQRPKIQQYILSGEITGEMHRPARHIDGRESIGPEAYLHGFPAFGIGNALQTQVTSVGRQAVEQVPRITQTGIFFQVILRTSVPGRDLNCA